MGQQGPKVNVIGAFLLRLLKTDGRGIARLQISFPNRQLDTHRRSFPRVALPLHLRADFPGSFADADAAEVAGVAVGLGGGVEAVAVVGDPESEDGGGGVE
jgi:hypothetical protein